MVVQNAFQILLTGEYTKSIIFYAHVVIVYINLVVAIVIVIAW